MTASDLFASGQFKDLGYYVISGRGPWDGRHCPACGSVAWHWIQGATPERSRAHCQVCPTEWLVEPRQ